MLSWAIKITLAIGRVANKSSPSPAAPDRQQRHNKRYSRRNRLQRSRSPAGGLAVRRDENEGEAIVVQANGEDGRHVSIDPIAFGSRQCSEHY